MCKLCRKMEAAGRSAAKFDLAQVAGAMVRASESGADVNPEPFLAAFAAEVANYYQEFTRHRRAEGLPKCPMEVNQA